MSVETAAVVRCGLLYGQLLACVHSVERHLVLTGVRCYVWSYVFSAGGVGVV